MKRMLSIVLALILCLCQLPVISFADAAQTAVTPLSDFTFTLNNEDNTVTLTKYTGSDSIVIVAGSYTVDGVSYATFLDSTSVFIYNSVITSVTVQGGVRLANNTAAYLFGMCTSLISADLSGLNTTGATDFFCMFAYCSALETLDVTGLDTACVTNMTGLFTDCEKLTALTGYENWDTGAVESIYMAFNKTYCLDKIDLSRWDLSRVTNSGWCFQLCSASQILLPDSLKTVSAGFMNHASKYAGTSFAVPAGVEKIGYAHTFYDFGTGDFAEFTVAEGNTHYTAVDGILYSADGKELLAVPRSKTFADGVYEIPEGVTFLGELCFSRNYNIKTLILPDSLDIYYVGLSDPNYIIHGDDGNLNAGSNLNIAIYCYTGITSYAVKNTNPNYTSIDGIIYSKDMTTVVAVPSRYDRNINIPEGVTAWAYEAMWAVDEATVTGLMSNCPGVSIPSTLVDISQDQIDKLNRLKVANAGFSITVSADNPAYCLDENGCLTTRSFTPETEPTVTEPPATEPTETKPVETVPSETAPSKPQPTETTPLETEPTVTVPTVTEPAQTEPAVTEPAHTEPAVTEPGQTEPAATGPVEVKPMETMPSVTEPSETQSAETTSPATGPSASEPGQTEPTPEAPANEGQDRSGGSTWWLTVVRAGCLVAGIGAAMIACRKKETKP